jgi:acetolactate synthase-1/2/3 large subunit
MDSSIFLQELCDELEVNPPNWSDWVDFLNEIKTSMPTFEDCQRVAEPYLSPQEVMSFVSTISGLDDAVVAASSGGTFTATMQNFISRGNQRLIGNKGLASMGYGLAGAIGISLARPEHRTILFEGDGGFAQNLQDLGTVVARDLNIKIFITSNDGYASIRTSQKNYFGGHYLGCDNKTGLHLPDWEHIGKAFGVETLMLSSSNFRSERFLTSFASSKPTIYIVVADPEQTYMPKIFSKVDSNGQMESTPLHDMYPPPSHQIKHLFRHIPKDLLPEFKS